MSFRGELLAVAEGEQGGRFHVISPDASLRLVPSSTPSVLKRGPCISEHKVVVIDYVTSALQQVTCVSSVLLKNDTQSALWVACENSPPTTIPSSVSPGDSSTTFPILNVPGSLYSFDRSLVKRVCYCFYFQTKIEYELFERTLTASKRLQAYSLMEKSVQMEMEIQKDREVKEKVKILSHEHVQIESLGRVRTKTKSIEPSPSVLCRNDPKKRDGIRQLPRNEHQNGTIATSKIQEEDSSNVPSSVATSPTHLSCCILCERKNNGKGNGNRSNMLVLHPYVLKDGYGTPVQVCKRCLHGVLIRRVRVSTDQRDPLKTDSMCGLCSEPVTSSKKDSKKCVHPQCPRIYCADCLKKLIGQAQVHRVWRTKEWYCPNCTKPGETEEIQPLKSVSKSTSPTRTTRERTILKGNSVEGSPKKVPTIKQKKRKREVKTSESVSTTGRPITSKQMSPLEYAATYYDFVTKRELQPLPPRESEDSCFCCKDGGELIECDCKDGEVKCPKVYHEDCLGFKVPEDTLWICPRHRCLICGFGAHFACRFCPTSYCKDHVVKEIKKLGPATPDISKLTYVLCEMCDKMSMEAVEAGHLKPIVYDRVLHTTKKKKSRRNGG